MRMARFCRGAPVTPMARARLAADSRPPTVPAPTDDLEDTELLARCRAGEEAAWQALVRRYQRLIYTVPRRAGLGEAQAADVFQTVFSRLFEHLDRIEDGARVRAWLVTTARREALRVLEQARRVAEPAGGDGSDNDDFLANLADTAPLPDELLAALQAQDRVRRAVEQLDERSRRFVELSFLQDEPLPYEEIARRLGIAVGSIGPTRARCLAKLRAKLMAP
jgi:RNA polymerase sigma factor (sigma-70 family)